MTDTLAPSVLIVGYGPVGKLLAIHLGRRGHSVVVVDKNVSDYRLPRAVTHCSDFARILQNTGLAPDSIDHITQPYDDMYSWRNGADDVLMEVDWSGLGESGWNNTYFFHQPDLEDALDTIVRGLATVHVLRGWEAESMTIDDACATVVARPSSGEARSLAITASWVVGADGANSAVRRWADLGWHDDGYFFDWLVVDVRPGPDLDFPHVARQYCDVARPSTMVPGGPGRRRWEFMRLPHESRDDLDRSSTAWKLLQPYGVRPDNAQLERHSVYTFQACWATEWRRGPVLLAGDAAHLMPPFAGQGLGAGVRDVMNLSWKLDAVLRGIADSALLDTYGSERLHHAKAFVEFSTSLGQVICITDPGDARARDERMIAERAAGNIASAPPRPGLGPGLHVGDAGGTLARQGRVRTGVDEIQRFDDAFDGPGAVIARTMSDLAGVDDDGVWALAQWGVDVVTLAGRSDATSVGDATGVTVGDATGVTVVDDVDGTYREWLDDLGANVVLVRPDFHVYGAATSAAELVDGFLAAAHGPAARVGADGL